MPLGGSLSLGILTGWKICQSSPTCFEDQQQPADQVRSHGPGGKLQSGNPGRLKDLSVLALQQQCTYIMMPVNSTLSMTFICDIPGVFKQSRQHAYKIPSLHRAAEAGDDPAMQSREVKDAGALGLTGTATPRRASEHNDLALTACPTAFAPHSTSHAAGLAGSNASRSQAIPGI